MTSTLRLTRATPLALAPTKKTPVPLAASSLPRPPAPLAPRSDRCPAHLRHASHVPPPRRDGWSRSRSASSCPSRRCPRRRGPAPTSRSGAYPPPRPATGPGPPADTHASLSAAARVYCARRSPELQALARQLERERIADVIGARAVPRRPRSAESLAPTTAAQPAAAGLRLREGIDAVSSDFGYVRLAGLRSLTALARPPRPSPQR